jgi:hypothetical protein
MLEHITYIVEISTDFSQIHDRAVVIIWKLDLQLPICNQCWDRPGLDCMVVGFTTTNAI